MNYEKIAPNTKFLIIGLGLMGGSYARALKREGFYVEAIDKDFDAIEYALDKDIIDVGSTLYHRGGGKACGYYSLCSLSSRISRMV